MFITKKVYTIHYTLCLQLDFFFFLYEKEKRFTSIIHAHLNLKINRKYATQNDFYFLKYKPQTDATLLLKEKLKIIKTYD